MKKNIVVTGASGFIGSCFLKLFGEKYNIYAISKSSNVENVEQVIPIQDYTEASINDIAELLPENIDGVINLAAYGLSKNDNDPALFLKSNVNFPFALLKLCKSRGCHSFVSIGSVSEYAEVENHCLIGESAKLTEHLYGASKQFFNLLASSYCQLHSISFVHLRLFNVYGEGEHDQRLLPYIIRNLRQQNAIKLTDGEQVRDFVYITDAVEAIDKALQKSFHSTLSETINICTSTPTKVKSLIQLTQKTLGVSSNLLKFGEVERRKDETMWAVGDSRKANELLEWKPLVSLEAGIEKMLLYFGKNNEA